MIGESIAQQKARIRAQIEAEKAEASAKTPRKIRPKGIYLGEKPRVKRFAARLNRIYFAVSPKAQDDLCRMIAAACDYWTQKKTCEEFLREIEGFDAKLIAPFLKAFLRMIQETPKN